MENYPPYARHTQTMQVNPSYNHVLLDIYDFFEEEIEKFKKTKNKDKLILDPGIGFGKSWNIIWWY